MPAERAKNNVVAARWIYDPKVRGIVFQAVAVACVACRAGAHFVDILTKE